MAQQAIHKFILGHNEADGKNAEFEYDRGWYSISEIKGEERDVIYKSKNAREAYMKWNVYIGRKKERPAPDDQHRQEVNDQHHNDRNSGQDRGRRENNNRRRHRDNNR